MSARNTFTKRCRGRLRRDPKRLVHRVDCGTNVGASIVLVIMTNIAKYTISAPKPSRCLSSLAHKTTECSMFVRTKLCRIDSI
jgi:hypothetical protein